MPRDSASRSHCNPLTLQCSPRPPICSSDLYVFAWGGKNILYEAGKHELTVPRTRIRPDLPHPSARHRNAI
jgi:hypothetical protein